MRKSESLSFIGSGSLLLRCLQTAWQRSHSIALVITPDRHIQEWAESHQIAFAPDLSTVNCATLSSCNYLFSVGYLKVLPPEIFSAPKKAAINFHDGPLPTYAGLNVPMWALLAGEQSHAISWHLITEELDGGAVLVRNEFDIPENCTAIGINALCYEQGFVGFQSVLTQVEDGALLGKAQEDLASRQYFSRVKKPKNAGFLDWQGAVSANLNLVQALDCGSYDNPLSSAKLRLVDDFVIVSRARKGAATVSGQPGEIIEISEEALAVQCVEGVLELIEFRGLGGQALSPAKLAEFRQLKVGQLLPVMDAEAALSATELAEKSARYEERWLGRLGSIQTLELEGLPAAEAVTGLNMPPLDAQAWQSFPADLAIEYRLSALCAYLASEQSGAASDLLFLGAGSQDLQFSNELPLRLYSEGGPDFKSFHAQLEKELSWLRKHNLLQRDILARYPGTFNKKPSFACGIAHADALPGLTLWSPGCVWQVSENLSQWRLNVSDFPDVQSWVARVTEEVNCYLSGIARNPDQSIASYPIVSATTAHKIVNEFNASERIVFGSDCVHEQIESQVKRTPEATALCFQDRSVTYLELNQLANRVAWDLLKRGVQPGSRIGLCLPRSIERVVAMLGVLKVGAAYVPLDPEYPIDRLKMVCEDGELASLIADHNSLPLAKSLHGQLPVSSIEQIIAENCEYGSDPLVAVAGELSAYVMFTSGSTGRPKGVMVTHANVTNFFTGMDERIQPAAVQENWLAITSFSFDISVLELLWTLARGFKVVLYDPRDGVSSRHNQNAAPRLSLSYFASEASPDRIEEGYKLLFAGAEIADQNGFEAIWTPERHFHKFGGLYPNPAVLSSALAARTKNLHIRAGSVVMPLHHPVRIAEDWALVDLLSNGRTGIAFASGWQENDFVFFPENYENRKDEMFVNLEKIKRLWAGEKLDFPGVNGKIVNLSITPLPRQEQIPVWITAAGNPDTFRKAGEIGANILTHLLGQKFPELAEKVQIYQAAWRAAGHAGTGKVTLMLHTYLGVDQEEVRATVHDPLCQYLRGALDLVKNAPFDFPTFTKPTAEIAEKVEQGLKNFTAAELEVLLEFAFDRYFETSGLFGTLDQARQLIDRAAEAGATEVACLVDFGVPYEKALTSLELLAQLNQTLRASESDNSFAALVARHQITHFQCTPSTLNFIAQADGGLTALGAISNIFVGGEALPGDLARKIAALPGVRLMNMYGPTETTIWSSTRVISAGLNGDPTIGKPIANTEILLIDQHGRLVPIGKPGEIYIGGLGVATGYCGRPDLTAERFVEPVLTACKYKRFYRTGDFGRWTENGEVEFLGRKDQQVKIRGYRIELGEIEEVGRLHSGILDSVCTVYKDADSVPALVFYYRSREALNTDVLREHLAARLPTYMVPSYFVQVDEFPLTPNKKIDRQALPAPVLTGSRTEQDLPGSQIEEKIAAVWKALLNKNSLSVTDNLFDLGVNSLMLIQGHIQLQESLALAFPFVKLFEHTSVRKLADFLEAGSAVNQASQEMAEQRGSSRRDQLLRRKRAAH